MGLHEGSYRKRWDYRKGGGVQEMSYREKMGLQGGGIQGYEWLQGEWNTGEGGCYIGRLLQGSMVRGRSRISDVGYLNFRWANHPPPPPPNSTLIHNGNYKVQSLSIQRKYKKQYS